MNPDLHAQLQAFIEQMPFVRQFDLQINKAQRGLIEVAMKPFPALFNHFKTYQAGACFTLAEVTGGLACGTFIDLADTFLVTKRIEISYIYPSDQALIATAEVSTGMIERTLSTLNKKNKTTLVVEVVVKDKDQNIIVRTSNEYYLRKGIPRSFTDART